MADVPARVLPSGTRRASGQRIGVAATPQQLGLAVPPLTIRHQVRTRAQSEAGLRIGTFEYRKRNVGETVEVVFLRQDWIRRYDKPRTSDGKRSTLCASVDGIVPVDYAPRKQAETCGACELAPWTDKFDAQGRPVMLPDGRQAQNPPKCDLSLAFLGIFAEDQTSPLAGHPFWFTCTRTAMPHARAFLAEWDAQRMSALFEWKVRMTLKEERKRQGTYFVPVFEAVDYYPLDKYQRLYEETKEHVFVHFIGRGGSGEGGDDEGDDDPGDSGPPSNDAPPPTDADLI